MTGQRSSTTRTRSAFVRLCAATSAVMLLSAAGSEVHAQQCARTIKASVVALDQPYMWNRLGAANPVGMVYALERDVVPIGYDPTTGKPPGPLKAGQVRLRADKRARPLVLRANVGDCLEVTLTNLLRKSALQQPPNTNVSVTGAPTRFAGFHVMGLELVGSIASDSSWVGRNMNSSPETRGSLVVPGGSATYTLYAKAEGTFLVDSGADGTAEQVDNGLFGAVNVQPEGAEWYRSQVTRGDLHRSACGVDPKTNDLPDCPTMSLQLTDVIKDYDGERRKVGQLTTLTTRRKTVQTMPVAVTPDGRLYGDTGHPIVNYKAVYTRARYPSGQPIPEGTPILSMLQVVKGQKQGADETLKELVSYVDEIRDLERGFLPQGLRKLFEDRRIQLSEDLTVTHDGGYRVVIADRASGESYLVEVVRETPTQNTLSIYDASLELAHSDLTAIITGRNADRFPYSNVSPSFRENPATPDRRQPYREFTIFYHQPRGTVVQAFPQFYDANLQSTLNAGQDGFAINYGTAGIGAEILANRLGVGPMGREDAVDLKYEEFFLSSWSVGDPAMVVDVPANADFQTVFNPEQNVKEGIDGTNPLVRLPGTLEANKVPKATKAFYPDDPSNVYHSYMRDHTKFRILHAGSGPSHVHHLHAHQWLHSPNSDDGHYLDSQMIIPGSAYTLEIAYNGSGNRNQTVGDSIFHCHFYPHFAQGMWGLWRVHDVFEAGTKLGADGRPLYGPGIWNRALPDGEIKVGTPVPAVVPLPTLAMAPLPARVRLANDTDPGPKGKYSGRLTVVEPQWTGLYGVPYYKNPGYPFFIPGVAGHRAPHPPLDFAWVENPDGTPKLEGGKKQYLDGGLPRHLILDGTIVREVHTRWDFTKDFALYSTEDIKEQDQDNFIAGSLTAFELPEEGTGVEQAAMRAHATRTHPSILPNGDPGNFILNGLPPAPGAPYAAPDVNDDGDSVLDIRRYKAAVVQTDVVLNKKGWHYPQQRFLTLWEDVVPTMNNERPPQPFFFRSNTGDSIEFWHTDLVPFYYELDDFQVRTPTDVIGQHIHLVKFDVTSSDGAANGFNYEDGTLSPDEVRDRIHAINGMTPGSGGLYAFDEKTQFQDPSQAGRTRLKVKPCKDWYVFCQQDPSLETGPPGQNWDGAQTTIQRWDTDPLLNNEGVDRTLRTVFTHDHFSPSTHQQVGLYAGLVVEPEGSEWYLPNGEPMYTRDDGGPTNWAGIIVTSDPEDSYREFLLEFQDAQLAYTKDSPTATSAARFDPSTVGTTGTPPPPAGLVDVSVWLALTKGIDFGGTSANPACQPNCVPDDVRAEFANAGVVLSDAATITPGVANEPPSREGTKWWTVINPLPDCPAAEEACKQRYPIRRDKTEDSFVYAASIAPGWADPETAIHPQAPNVNPCSATAPCAPYPQLVTFSAGNPGTYSLNYRNEPTSLRVASGSGDQTDLGAVFKSIERGDQDLNCQPGLGNPIGDPCGPSPSPTGTGFQYPKQPLVPRGPNGVQPYDPYTPLMRAYANDSVQVRTLVGAHQQTHTFTMHGLKWHFEPSYTNSGYRNAQGMGISEHFEMLFDLPPSVASHSDGLPPSADYLYAPSAGVFGLVNGLWGILRAYGEQIGAPGDDDYLKPLPNNPQPGASTVELDYKKLYDQAKRKRSFTIAAKTTKDAFGGPLVYNEREKDKARDPNALVYVLIEEDGQRVSERPMEPLILRVAAGDWIEITLKNHLPPNLPSDKNNVDTCCNSSPFGSNIPFDGGPGPLPSIALKTSSRVGLHPQLLSFDVTQSNGVDVGLNPVQTLPAQSDKDQTYYWYAGNLSVEKDCQPTATEDCVVETPIEFGATGLVPADLVLQHQKGLYGALIVEPENSTWVADPGTRAAATVTRADGTKFRDFVVVLQNDLLNFNLSGGDFGSFGAVNYRYESAATRGRLFATEPQQRFFSNVQVGDKDPVTPIFKAEAGTPTRFHVVFPGGMTVNQGQRAFVVTLHGHVWQEEPYVENSQKIGDNRLSQWFGGQLIVPYQNIDIDLPSAGGTHAVVGDYLYSTYQQAPLTGTWGIFRVCDPLGDKAGQDAQSLLGVDGGACPTKPK